MMTREEYDNNIDNIVAFFKTRGYTTHQPPSFFTTATFTGPDRKYYDLEFTRQATIAYKQRYPQAYNYEFIPIPNDVLEFFDKLNFRLTDMHMRRTGQRIDDWWE